jgi:hypothetical protein
LRRAERNFISGGNSFVLHTFKGSAAEFSARGCSAAWHSDPVHIEAPIIVWKLEKRQYSFCFENVMKNQKNIMYHKICMLLFLSICPNIT